MSISLVAVLLIVLALCIMAGLLLAFFRPHIRTWRFGVFFESEERYSERPSKDIQGEEGESGPEKPQGV